jgi:hypothetical protein
MFIVFSGTDPNSKMIFKCYYCKFETGELLQIIQHCNTEHANEALKYREEVLDDKSGKLRLQRKHRQGIIHSVLCKEGKEIVVLDNQTYICDIKNKKKRLNTPVKENESRRRLLFQHSNSGDDEAIDAVDRDQIEERRTDTEITIDNSGMDLNVTAENKISSAVDDLSYLLPSVLDSLESAGQLETYMKFNQLLAEKTFPLDNICYLLFRDLVQWFSCSNTSNMRYNEHTIKFWQIGYRRFHGKYLRFMSGLRKFWTDITR